MFTSPHEVDDPAYLSPKYRQFHEPALPQRVPARPLPQPAPRPRPPLPPRGPQPFELPAQPVPSPRPLPSDDAGGPELVRPDEPPAPRLDLAVAAPTTAQVGGSVLFEIRVTNRGAAPATNVVLEATLDGGLRLPERADRRVVHPLGTIPAGQSREAALTVVGDQTGRPCASFLVTSGGRESGWKKVCVEFVPRKLDVAMTAPEQARVGGRATFVVSVANVTPDPIENVELLVTPGDPLRPVGGSAGARATADGLVWTLGRLAAGERVSVEIDCECRAVAERACLRAHVTADAIPAESLERCLEIIPQVSSTRLTVPAVRGRAAGFESGVRQPRASGSRAGSSRFPAG
ncbi:MAG TPA: hypothetical protein VML55_06880 [Planctomycetaceae bacterium]|nr:hypothetical protein [Planctomycetaceae bacterium]